MKKVQLDEVKFTNSDLRLVTCIAAEAGYKTYINEDLKPSTSYVIIEDPDGRLAMFEGDTFRFSGGSMHRGSLLCGNGYSFGEGLVPSLELINDIMEVTVPHWALQKEKDQGVLKWKNFEEYREHTILNYLEIDTELPKCEPLVPTGWRAECPHCYDFQYLDVEGCESGKVLACGVCDRKFKLP